MADADGQVVHGAARVVDKVGRARGVLAARAVELWCDIHGADGDVRQRALHKTKQAVALGVDHRVHRRAARLPDCAKRRVSTHKTTTKKKKALKGGGAVPCRAVAASCSSSCCSRAVSPESCARSRSAAILLRAAADGSCGSGVPAGGSRGAMGGRERQNQAC